MLAMAPYLIVISLFVGGMYLAIDSTVGERERGSLEPLLINPLGRAELVLGKAAAVLLFTLVALVETLIGFAVILNLVPLERFLGVQMSLPPRALVSILLVACP
jgi:sodium transport system permease protein